MLATFMRVHMIGAKGIPSDSVPGAGGVERHVEQMATRLAEHGHRVSVYIRKYSDYKKHTWNGVRLIRIPSFRSKNLDTISHVFLSTLHVLFQETDIIHYHGVGPSTMAWIPRVFKPKVKVVCTFHSRDWFDSKWGWFAKSYLKFGEWAAVHFPHRTIVISHTLQVWCRNKWKKQTDYIPNGADLLGPQGASELQRFGLVPGQYFLGVGRLVPNKAYEVAIEAYRHVKSDFPLVIVGESFHSTEYDHRLRNLAERDLRVRLIGYQSGTVLRQLFANCYAFIHPSRAEGLSVTIIEAMAAGKVVIMSDIKENLELIDHSGISFKTDDRDELKTAIELVLEDPAMVEERGTRGRERVKQERSWARVADKLEKWYKDVRQ